MSPNGPNGGVIWKVATGVLGAVVLVTGAVWGMVGLHAQSDTHPGALPRGEFDVFEKNLDRRLDRMEAKLDRLLDGR